MKLDGYIRVSDVRGRGGETFISPDQQRDKIVAWAKLHDHEVVAWEEELDVSGGKLDRPKLDRIMERIRSGETGGIAIAKLDRFSRAGVGDALALIEEIKELGAVFGCVEPAIDTGDPVMGEFVLTIFLALARMERQRIGATWRDSRARAVRRGHHVGASAPYGYRKRAEDGRLEPDPVEAQVVREVFQRRAAGASWGDVSRWLKAEGILTRNGVPWSVSSLGRMVNNVVHLGVLQEATSGERLEGAHPALIDQATWQAAQARRSVRGAKSDDAGGLLRGIVRCAGCRYAVGQQKVGRSSYGVTKNGTQRTRLICWRGARNGGNCPDPASVRLNDIVRPLTNGGDRRGLEAYVVDEVFKRLDEIEAEAFGADTEIARLEDEQKRSRDALAAHAADLELLEALGRDAYLARAEALRDAAEQAEAEFNLAMRLNAGRLQQPVRRLREDWETMGLEERRSLLARLIQAIFIRNTGRRIGSLAPHVRIVWFDEPEIDIPRQGRRDYVVRPFPFDGADDPDQIVEVSA